MNVVKKFGCVASVVLFAGSMVHATPLGYNTTNPGGNWNRGDANSGYAFFDTIDSYQFSNDAADVTSGLLSATWSQSVAYPIAYPPTDEQLGSNAIRGAAVYDYLAFGDGYTFGDDVLFTGGVGSNFSASATTGFGVNSAIVQMKRAFNVGGFTVVPTLNGLTPSETVTVASSGSGDTNTTNGLYSITTYKWLNLGDTTSLNLQIGSIGGSRGIDGLTLDVSAVPEPAALSLLAAPAVMLLARRRRQTR